MALDIGSYVGPYRLLSLLMTGQTSSVWEALHDVRQQRYAVKVLLDETRADRQHRNFLKHEYEVGQQLDSPRVIKMQELGTQSGDYYLVLELYRQPNLKAVITREPARVALQGAKIIRQAAEGLAALHEKRWVHRDIKPDNFLVAPEGDVKLIDFALAQREVKGLGRFFTRRAPKIQGTRSYMSPEQIRGQPLDRRSDVYSFGCMLHEMFSGKPPFTGTDTRELFGKHLRTPAPALEVTNRDLTPEFCLLVRTMLNKKPEDRPATMDDFLSEFIPMSIYKQSARTRERTAKGEGK